MQSRGVDEVRGGGKASIFPCGSVPAGTDPFPSCPHCPAAALTRLRIAAETWLTAGSMPAITAP